MSDISIQDDRGLAVYGADDYGEYGSLLAETNGNELENPDDEISRLQALIDDDQEVEDDDLQNLL